MAHNGRIQQTARAGYVRELGAVCGRNNWWMATCEKHGEASFNTIVGCEHCARERQNNPPKDK